MHIWLSIVWEGTTQHCLRRPGFLYDDDDAETDIEEKHADPSIRGVRFRISFAAFSPRSFDSVFGLLGVFVIWSRAGSGGVW